MRDAPIFRNINPLSIPTVTLHNQLQSTTSTQVTLSDTAEYKEKTMDRVHRSLKGMLQREYGDAKTPADMEIRSPKLAHLPPKQAAQNLKRELHAYAARTDPFNRPMRNNETVIEWWVALQSDELCSVLGVSS